MIDNYKDLIIFSKNGSGDDDRRNYLLLILQKEMILKLIFLNLDYKLVQLNDILSYFLLNTISYITSVNDFT